MLPLFDDPAPTPAPKDNRPSAKPGTVAYDAWCEGFHHGAKNLPALRAGGWPDAFSESYYTEAYRIGRQFRPLPCMEKP